MNIAKELQKFGISQSVTRVFSGGDDPSLVNYLDLIRHPVNTSGDVVSLDGAVENDHRPVLYYVNESRLSIVPSKREEQLARIGRCVSCRGDRAYLGVVKPGLLEVSPVRLGQKQATWRVFKADSGDAITFYANLVHGNISGITADDPDLVFDEMYKLLLAGTDQIAHRIGKDNVLSLVGRALFFRFLCDRHIVTEADTHKICSQASELRACFDNSENAYQTSKWLDQTFNGHFLPLRSRGTRQFFEDLNRSTIVFNNLSAIVRGLEPIGANQFQHKFDWAVFDFAYVPVGLLSQVYEAFSWKWDSENAEDTSVHYTPRNIAVTLVEEAFDGLQNPAHARVLDPACGAGVFLVLAFRRLYMEHWRHSGKRPNTSVIRKILESQLCGFDISESALRLAALSLYLTAIELDPNPIPPEKLKFKDLDGLVLFNQRCNSEATSGPVVGSLRGDIRTKFNSQFDLVICNPPWSRIEDNNVADELNSISKGIISQKDKSLGDLYQNPRGEPDLPFLWKATEWCRPSGQLAMVLPSRILFRQGEIARRARTTLLKLIRLTGIVNCLNVRKTNVWPEMDQPFMLIFALNEMGADNDSFWFVSPQADYSLNRLGELRIDPHAAHVLVVSDVLNEDWLLKTLAIGTWLDVEVIRKIQSAHRKPLKDYWSKTLRLTSRQGYTVRGTPQNNASQMKDLLDVGHATEVQTQFRIDPNLCKRFSRPTLYRTRILPKGPDPLRVYRAPILLLRQSIPRDRLRGNAISSYVDIAFNKSFYGYSAHGHPNAVTLIRYLHIFAHTNLWLYFSLCLSAKLGFERTYFYKQDFDAFPLIPVEELSSDYQNRINALAARLESGDKAVFAEIDSFFGELYSLTEWDLQVIKDTLCIRNPHDELGNRGSSPVTVDEAEQFCVTLQSALLPFVRKLGRQLVIQPPKDESIANSFRFLSVVADADTPDESDALRELVIGLADCTGASMIVHRTSARLIIGILNQYRYWTTTRARLLAADILRDYFAVFEGHRDR